MTSITYDAGPGLAWGSYQVDYYRVQHGRICRLPDQDNGVPAGYVERIRLRPNEIARARCMSQPDGATIFGSPAARDAWRRAE